MRLSLPLDLQRVRCACSVDELSLCLRFRFELKSALRQFRYLRDRFGETLVTLVLAHWRLFAASPIENVPLSYWAYICTVLIELQGFGYSKGCDKDEKY